MKNLLLVCALLTASGLSGAILPTTRFTVIAEVNSLEHYVASGTSSRFSLASPYGNKSTIVATIIAPASLAGREIAIPFESTKDGKELLVKTGTHFRWEHDQNLKILQSLTSGIGRTALVFPRRGIIVLTALGEVAETYPGPWNSKS